MCHPRQAGGGRVGFVISAVERSAVCLPLDPYNSAAESVSRYTVMSGWVRRRVDGHAVEMGSWMVRRTTCALRGPGTEAISFGTRKTVGIVNVSARSGASCQVGNQPSA